MYCSHRTWCESSSHVWNKLIVLPLLTTILKPKDLSFKFLHWSNFLTNFDGLFYSVLFFCSDFLCVFCWVGLDLQRLQIHLLRFEMIMKFTNSWPTDFFLLYSTFWFFNLLGWLDLGFEMMILKDLFSFSSFYFSFFDSSSVSLFMDIVSIMRYGYGIVFQLLW